MCRLAHHPPLRGRPVSLCVEVLPDLGQPLLQPHRLDRRERHPVQPRRSRIGAGQRIGMGQHVGAADLVVEQVEAGRRFRLRLCNKAFSEVSGYSLVLSGSSPITDPAVVESTPEVRAFPSAGITRPQRYHDPVRLPPGTAAQTRRWSRYPRAKTGLPRLPETPFRRAVSTTPVDRNGCRCRLLPHPTRPSPLFRRVGVHDFTFEACSGFTHVTARQIDQPPKAAFVTRLRPGRSPHQAARQLPDLTDNSSGGIFLHWCFAPSGRTE